MYVAMNRITVQAGKGPELESSFAQRARHVEAAPGFVAFHLLRPEQGNTYVSLSLWQTRADFEAWVRSEAFVAAHRSRSEGVVAGHPVLETFETVEQGVTTDP